MQNGIQVHGYSKPHGAACAPFQHFLASRYRSFQFPLQFEMTQRFQFEAELLSMTEALQRSWLEGLRSREAGGLRGWLSTVVEVRLARWKCLRVASDLKHHDCDCSLKDKKKKTTTNKQHKNDAQFGESSRCHNQRVTCQLKVGRSVDAMQLRRRYRQKHRQLSHCAASTSLKTRFHLQRHLLLLRHLILRQLHKHVKYFICCEHIYSFTLQVLCTSMRSNSPGSPMCWREYCTTRSVVCLRRA